MPLPTSLARFFRLVVLVAAASSFVTAPLHAQTPAKPAPKPAAPSTQAPAKPAPKPAPKPAAPRQQAPAKPAAPAQPVAQAPPAPPPAPVAQDLRFKTVYATGDLRTESVSYQKGARERFEFDDMVLIKQHDMKRTVQISRAANTYLVVPDGAAPALPTPPAGAAPATPGVVAVTTTIVDTGERKPIHGLQARHVKSTMDRQPSATACDPSKQRMETDGWYVDMPVPARAQDVGPRQPPGGCVDQINATQNGDPKVLGFPVSYSMTVTGDDGKPSVVTMEVTELEVTTLDAALFEIPAGLKEAGDVRALSQALSDVNEAKLTEQTATSPPTPPTAQRTPGSGSHRRRGTGQQDERKRGHTSTARAARRGPGRGEGRGRGVRGAAGGSS